MQNDSYDGMKELFPSESSPLELLEPARRTQRWHDFHIDKEAKSAMLEINSIDFKISLITESCF